MPETGKASASEGAAERKEDSQKSEAELQELRAKLQSVESNLSEAQKKAMAYDTLDSRYRGDPKFRASFDREWYGQAEEKREEAKNLSPEDHLRKEIQAGRENIQALQDQINGLKNAYVGDRVIGSRQGLNVKYEDEFRSMAEEVGYEYGTEAYDILYDNTVRSGYDVARKFGMVNEQGSPDPLVKYNDHFMKEAFNNAYQKHKSAGFDTAWKRKQDALRIEKERTKPNEMDRFFQKDKLKTLSDRARQLEKAFRFKTRGQNLKIV